MKKRTGMKRVLAVVLSGVLLCMSLAGCGGSAESTERGTSQINVAYQYGLAYAPVIIAKEQGLIEKAYEEATGKQVVITWNQMSSGADINTAFVSGSINVGFMGIAPAITGVANQVGYKVFTNLSGQEHGMMTSNPDIKSINDLVGSDKQIALVNIGSIQHIILAKALAHAGFDAHSLDSNIVAMKHPDGMSSLVSGSIPCHLTSNPYLYQEQDNESLYPVEGIADVWSVESSFIVGIASQDLKEKDPQAYEAVCKGIAQAIDYINANPEEAAKLTCEFNGNTLEDELKYMQKGNYSVETTGIFDLATFMSENGFIDKSFAAYEDLVFDNVKGN